MAKVVDGFDVSPDLQVFNAWIVKNYGGNTRTKTITNEKFLRIKNLIKGDTTNTNAKFRFWVRNKGFRLINYNEQTDKIKDDPEGDLYVSLHAREESMTNGNNIETFLRTNLPAISFFRKVAVVEDFYEIIKKSHIDAKGQHAGQKKTYRLVSDTYAFLPREVITFYLLNCDACKPRIQKYGPMPKTKKTQQPKAEKFNKTKLEQIQLKEGTQIHSPLSYHGSSDQKYQEHKFANNNSIETKYEIRRYNYNNNNNIIVKNNFHQHHIEEPMKNENTISLIKDTIHAAPINKYIDEDTSYGPPSLCYIPKGKRNFEERKFHPLTKETKRLDSAVDSIYRSKPALRSSFDYFNYEQLKDVEDYIKERKKLFENQDDSLSETNYWKMYKHEGTKYPKRQISDLYFENNVKHYDYKGRSSSEEPCPKYQKIDYNFLKPYELPKLSTERDPTRYKHIGVSPYDLYPQNTQFYSPTKLGRCYQMVNSSGQGSVSSISSDVTDELIKDDEEVAATKIGYTFPYKRNAFNEDKCRQSYRLPYNRSERHPDDHVDSLASAKQHTLNQLLHTYKDLQF